MINSFTGEYFFLSNFAPARFVFRGYKVPTSEHAFVIGKAWYLLSCKTSWDEYDKVVDRIVACPTPGEVKKLGRSLKIDKQAWDDVKIDWMRKILYYKFAADPELWRKLRDTAPQMLVEGNTWDDTFWGMVDGRGRNVLGCLLMELRGYALYFQGVYEWTDHTGSFPESW